MRRLVTIFIILMFLFSIFNIQLLVSSKIEKYVPGQEGTIISSDEKRIENEEIIVNHENELFLNSDKIDQIDLSNFFTLNKGQVGNNDVNFYIHGKGIWFTSSGVVFELAEPLKTKSSPYDKFGNHFRNPENPERENEVRQNVVVTASFINCNDVIPVGKKVLPHKSNFFYGNDPGKWRTNVPNYLEIKYENIYDNIDLKYYFTDEGLKYDFIVHPGGYIEKIRIKYDGIMELGVDNNGDLSIETSIINIKDKDLFIYQNISNNLNEIKGQFKIYNNFEYGFELLEDYIKDEDLIIDPIIYSTFIGGSDSDAGSGIVTDNKGNVFVTGGTGSLDFPIKGAYDPTFNGYSDIYVLKLDKNGTSLYYSTYIGGSLEDYAYNIAIDLYENTYITGLTESSNFPTSTNAFDKTYNGGELDSFALKLNNSGSRLDYSTYIGGNNSEIGKDIKVDLSGRAFIKGWTNSSGFPTTLNAFDTTMNGEDDDFVLKLNSKGSGLIYSTFIGGSNSEIAYPSFGGIDIDLSGNAYIAGRTNSTDFPVTANAYNNKSNGKYDSFVLKLNSNGTDILYSTHVGGNEDDTVADITIDKEGNAFVAGMTVSSNFPTTINAINSSLNDGSRDLFVFKLNNKGSDLIFSTYLGGSGDDLGNAMAVDIHGNVFVTGQTSSSDFPITANASDTTFNGFWDCYVIAINHNATSVIYSSYIGGSIANVGWGIVVDSAGYVYVTGHTHSSDFNTTNGSFDRTFGGFDDGFVIKFSLPNYFVFNSVSLLSNSQPTNVTYARYSYYTYQVEIINTVNKSDLKSVLLTLDPLSTNIKLLWDSQTGLFSELSDPNNYISLDPSSKAENNVDQWLIDFNIVFNWTYPDEEINDIEVYATSALLSPILKLVPRFYSVENDLVFNGNLSVKNETNHMITNGELLKGGEKLSWTGLTPVYENTTNIYPPADEIDVILWDEIKTKWLDSPETGKPFQIENSIPNKSYQQSFTYTINLTGIPTYCDKTNVTFSIKVDSDEVLFSNPRPDNNTWQNTSLFVPVGITITDIWGSVVNGSSIKNSFSTNNGATWSDWKAITGLVSNTSVEPLDVVPLEEGTSNLIKWQAEDLLGNGPTISDEYRILVDTENVTFTNVMPNAGDVSTTRDVEVGITIWDSTSGVNASSIEYTVSYDNGSSWGEWRLVSGYDTNMSIDVKLNLTFPNGTGNRIKWRASDIAGNGPTESISYMININTWKLPPIIPKVRLLSPQNNAIIQTDQIELTWKLENINLRNVSYDVYIDNTEPPRKLNKSDFINTSLFLDHLSNGATYHWTVVPKLGSNNGSCLSGVWSFKLEIPIPSVKLTSPKNNSIVTTLIPTLSWSVEYDGDEVITYEVYLYTKDDLSEYTRFFGPQDFVKPLLEDGQKYYWKVIPWAGSFPGRESETWSFTVDLPRYAINLTLNPTAVRLTPGETISVKAIAKNLADLPDRISLSINVPANSGVDAIVNEPGNRNVSSEGSITFDLWIKAKEGAQKNTMILTIVIVSEKAAENGQDVKEEAKLKVTILDKTQSRIEISSSSNTFWLILFIIIIIALIVFFIYYRKKTQKGKEETEKEEELAQESEESQPDSVEEISLGDAENTLVEDEALQSVPVPEIEIPPEQIPVSIPEETQNSQLPPSTISEPVEARESPQAQASEAETQIKPTETDEKPLTQIEEKMRKIKNNLFF